MLVKYTVEALTFRTCRVAIVVHGLRHLKLKQTQHLAVRNCCSYCVDVYPLENEIGRKGWGIQDE